MIVVIAVATAAMITAALFDPPFALLMAIAAVAIAATDACRKFNHRGVRSFGFHIVAPGLGGIPTAGSRRGWERLAERCEKSRGRESPTSGASATCFPAPSPPCAVLALGRDPSRPSLGTACDLSRFFILLSRESLRGGFGGGVSSRRLPLRADRSGSRAFGCYPGVLARAGRFSWFLGSFARRAALTFCLASSYFDAACRFFRHIFPLGGFFPFFRLEVVLCLRLRLTFQPSSRFLTRGC